ncbi:hypothetical protein [Streptomyces sp. NBC_00258]|uniref:hypothetical protein n=1 Tax=Streptomyces sp. NBC_00258 TaxID=2903642 RepID=UPI002E2DD0B2|nr:hypothetical protein [Streptomyces sp. NBC_00258]
MTAAIDAMDVETRRTFLLAVVRNKGCLVTTGLALRIYAASPWKDISRNTARRDLRDLARRGRLVPAEHRGVRFYRLSGDPNCPHPVRNTRQLVLEAIRTEGGEWTTGRTRRTWHQIAGTHVLRASVRRYLAALHRDGHLDRHGDGTPRRFYTPAETRKGAAR